MQNINILEELFDWKKISIIKLFLREKETEFYLREIARKTGVPPATAHRIISKLVRLQIVREIKVKAFKVYILNQSQNVEFLDTILKEETRIVELFVEEVKRLPGIESIIQHGEERKDKVNILIIGKDVDANEIKRICAEIKDKYNFRIYSLTLTNEQYEQMSSMGLYSGQKKVLFGK